MPVSRGWNRRGRSERVAIPVPQEVSPAAIPVEASTIEYSPTAPITSTNVQGALDQLAASVAAGVGDGDKGDITVSGVGTVWTVDNDAVTYAKMQNVSATDKVLGRSTAGAGDVEEIACTAAGRALIDDADATAQRTTLGLGTLATQSGTFSGTSSGTNTGDQTITLTGDVTGSGTGSFAATIAARAVTAAKFLSVTDGRLLGRDAGSAGDVQEIRCTSGLALTGSAQLGIQTAGVSSAMLRDSGPLSVMGRSANSTGVPADISATAASGAVLRESGSTVGFGTIATAGIAANAVTDAKLRQGAALTVIGRATNSTGDVADIATSADGDVLRRSGTTLGFGTIATAGLADASVTYAKIQNVSATDKVLGRSTAGAGVVEEIACTAAGRALIDDADATTQLATLGIDDIPSDVDRLKRALSAMLRSWIGIGLPPPDGIDDILQLALEG